MTVPMKQPTAVASADIMESLLLKGDLAKLTPQERVSYYSEVCKSVGLNPLTKPFEYITLNGKLTLYALRACTDQLRKVNNVSLEIVSREVADDLLTIHVRALLPDGRHDEDLGAVSFPATLKGEARANQELKCITKAKRRATLSICGLGWLDETEIADIPASAKRPPPPAANVMIAPPAHDAETGEVIEQSADEPAHPVSAPAAAAPSNSTPLSQAAAGNLSVEDIAAFDATLAKAAENGTEVLKQRWDQMPKDAKEILKAALERRHKPRAAEIDKLGPAKEPV